jgi:hypothetical protein
MTNLTLSRLQEQTMEAARLMTRFHDYAKSIGCTTYEEGLLCDSIECNAAQSQMLTEWWRANK